MRRFSSFSKIIITFLVLFHSTIMGSNDLIQLSCKKASQGDPNLSYKFCVSSLEANAKGHSLDLQELVVISLNLTVANATNINSTISKLLKDKAFDKFAKECLRGCSELYADAIPTLQEALCAFQSKDFAKANIEVSSAMDASSTCEDGFKEKKGEVSPLRKENDVFFQLNAISLAFINTLASI
ncbi:PREDICTED: putative invertase inhibitor [Prunus mume]|uniref:Invertase inhibitor n=1 Tax=Prunus mume TaxID=102107 RepID=A0ABM0NTA4_PRUMU|nr:PREDICTED: putative invertase inhibitor [Prunus mume]